MGRFTLKTFLTFIISFTIFWINSGAVLAASLPAGTVVPVSMTSRVNADHVSEGDVVSIKVVKDVTHDGKVFFEKGTVGLANIASAKRGRHHGGAGYIEIKEGVITDVEGKEHQINFNIVKEGQHHRILGISLSILGVLLTLIPWGAWKKGEPAIVESNQIFNAVIKSSVDL